MCELSTPVMFWSSLAMTAASAGAQYMAQQEQADQTRAYQAKVAAEQNRVLVEAANAANKEYVEQAAASNIQLDQKQQSYSLDEQQTQVQREQRVGTAIASSENAGLSLEALTADFYRQEAKHKAAIAQQLNMDYVQNDIAIQGMKTKAANRTAAIPQYIPSPVSNPSLLGAGLQIGAGDLNSFYAFSDKVTDPTTGRTTGRRLG